MNALEGFVTIDRNAWNSRSSRCPSRELLEAFLESGNDCMAKPMEDDELKRAAYNLRKYRKSHTDEFQDVGISQRGGRLILYRM